MLIVDPSISEDDRNASIDNVKTLLEANGKIVKEDIWGEKKLAYKINKSEKGFYVLFELELNGLKIKEISSSINLDKNIWRYMFVKKDS
ncbi:30S ribosomal protein S6 [Candidatus Gracilibacteria bacterium]|nr:MAG: 30S ribosomal protein S6 [Candidatus Gracilibacteria bacterium]